MSTSPFDSGNSKPLRSSQASAAKAPAGADAITLTQALIITAGMAGLIGLFSGVIIRFSLANSPNARFLSPLQTFPTLSNWTPEPAQSANGEIDVADGNFDQAAQSEAIRTFESSEPPDYLQPDYLQEESEGLADDPLEAVHDMDAVDVTTFDAFADRPSRRSPAGRWDALESGPKFSQDQDSKSELRPYGESELDDFERDRSADVNGNWTNQTPSDENFREFDDGEDSYLEEIYSEESYPEENYFYDDYPENDYPNN